jgi:hypothetical protein
VIQGIQILPLCFRSPSDFYEVSDLQLRGPGILTPQVLGIMENNQTVADVDPDGAFCLAFDHDPVPSGIFEHG